MSIDVTMGTCEEENITYDDGETFMKDLCTTCQCNNGTINCTTETCPDCKQGTLPFNVSHQCCPECRPGKNRSCDLLINYNITELPSCELMQRDPELLTLFNTCHSVQPIIKSYCPEQCKDDDVIKCCITRYVTKADKFVCENLPGFETDIKYTDAQECICEPCG